MTNIGNIGNCIFGIESIGHLVGHVSWSLILVPFRFYGLVFFFFLPPIDVNFFLSDFSDH